MVSVGDIGRWQEAASREGPLRHPCLTPGFALAVGRARHDARVALLSDADGRRGFFAFCLGPGRVARPMGLHLSDCQGVVADDGLEWSADELRTASRLRGIEYDHVPVEQEQLQPHHRVVDAAPSIDLSGGFAAYVEQRSPKMTATLRRARRRLEQDHGAVEIRFDTGSEHLDALLRWKSAQYRRTGAPDGLAPAWTREVIADLVAAAEPGVSAPIAALLVGGRPIALHLGLRAGSVMSSWIPAYDPSFAATSPGLQLLMGVIEAAAADGVRMIDLGRGQAQYKERMKTGDRWVGQGWVGRPTAATWRADARRRAAAVVDNTPAGPAARRVRDTLRRVAAAVQR